MQLWLGSRLSWLPRRQVDVFLPVSQGCRSFTTNPTQVYGKRSTKYSISEVDDKMLDFSSGLKAMQKVKAEYNKKPALDTAPPKPLTPHTHPTPSSTPVITNQLTSNLHLHNVTNGSHSSPASSSLNISSSLNNNPDTDETPVPSRGLYRVKPRVPKPPPAPRIILAQRDNLSQWEHPTPSRPSAFVAASDSNLQRLNTPSSTPLHSTKPANLSQLSSTPLKSPSGFLTKLVSESGIGDVEADTFDENGVSVSDLFEDDADEEDFFAFAKSFNEPFPMPFGEKVKKGKDKSNKNRVPKNPALKKIRLRRQMSLRHFSLLTGIPILKLIRTLQQYDPSHPKLTRNAVILEENQATICEHYGKPYEKISQILADQIRDPSCAEAERAPVVCVMGHVDHGKTTMLDVLRKTTIAAKEHGGITQSIGAFSVDDPGGGKIIFIDTPGHAAFHRMRAHGANKNLTDIIVLVVSADAGVQQQTVETIKLAQDNGIPLAVAITKCDLDVDPLYIRNQLLTYGVVTEIHGGDVLCVNTSAKTGEGMLDLLESISLTTQLLELKSPFSGVAKAFVIESLVTKQRGLVCNVLVREGTLKVGDWVVCGREAAKVKAIYDSENNSLKEALPSTPVAIIGFTDLSLLDQNIQAYDSERIAKAVAAERVQMFEISREGELKKETLAIEDIFEEGTEIRGRGKKAKKQNKVKSEEEKDTIKEQENRQIRLIVKGNYSLSLATFVDYLAQLDGSNGLSIRILRTGLGQISKADVEFAAKTRAHIFGFGVDYDAQTHAKARSMAVQLHCDPVIYTLMDTIKEMLRARLPEEQTTERVGSAEIIQLFTLSANSSSKKTVAAGCTVVSGMLESSKKFRVLRHGVSIHEGVVTSLKRFKDPVQSVNTGLECSLTMEGFTEFQAGDFIECFFEKTVRPMVDDSQAMSKPGESKVITFM